MKALFQSILSFFCLLSLWQIPAIADLDFGTLKAVPISVISISPEDESKVPVPFGETVKLVAKTFPEGQHVEWSVVSEGLTGGEKAEATIDSNGNLTPTGTSGSGWVRVAATINGEGKREARVFIGCSSCQSGTSCDLYAGVGFVEIGSINFRISLGKAERGLTAGELYIYSKDPGSELATPEALQISTLSENVETTYVDKILRQVITPQAVVLINQLDEKSYEILFYEKGSPGDYVDGVFSPAPTAIPETKWFVEGTAPQQEFKDLFITETRQGKETQYQYSYDNEEKTWSLSSGNGSKLERHKESTNESGDRVVSQITTGLNSEIVSDIEETYHEFEWGEELIQRVVDPGGAKLTTSTRYIEASDGYSRIQSRKYPDGSWERYVYDNQGRITHTYRPYLDSRIDDDDQKHHVIINNYKPLRRDANREEDILKPRIVTELIQDVVVGKTYHLYTTSDDGGRVEITEQCSKQDCKFGDKENLTTVSTYYPENKQKYQSRKLQSVLQPDGSLTTYKYETGQFTPSYEPEKALFTPGEGKAVRKTVFHGTIKAPWGVPFKTTKETIITDWLGNRVMTETYVVTDKNGDGERINWTYNSFSKLGRLIETLYSNQTRTENSWNCCGKASTTNVDGVTTAYEYDDLKRITQQTNLATGVVTKYSYDALGRKLSTTVKGGKLTATSTSEYDLAGRMISTTDHAGLVTNYFYEQTISSVLRPGQRDEVTERFLDGKIKSVTGNGIVDRYYQYGVDQNGYQWTRVTYAKKNSPRYERKVSDLLGRVIRSEKAGFNGLEISESFYNEKGQQVRTTNPGMLDTLYVYDELGNVLYSGLDVDKNKQLELASNDRIQGQSNIYVKDEEGWWHEQSQTIYAVEGEETATTLSTSKTKLSGWSDFIVSKNVQTDIFGSKIISFEKLDRYNQERLRTTIFPDSEATGLQQFKNTFLVSSRSKSGITQKYSYDSLGRRVAVTDQRTGTSVTKYNEKHQIASVSDAAGNITRFIYDQTTGQKIKQINPDNKKTYFLYDPLGHMTHTWGDVPYPVSYAYNEYGEMVRMETYRTDGIWNGEKWPENVTGDVTQWIYDEPSGLLKEKRDAQQNGVKYSYFPGGKLAKRIWAREVFTDYKYYDTGELEIVDYSDETPDLSFTYDRLGRKATVTDALGKRSFDYNEKLQLLSETLADRTVLKRRYDGLGRNTGFYLNDFYQVKYDYDNLGRFSSIDYAAGNAADLFQYSYLENSDLLDRVISQSGFTTAYFYEPHRNLKTIIQNTVNEKLISRYEYQYDRLGKRYNVKNSGSAFAQPSFTLYGYNDRNEVQDMQRFIGNDLTNQTKPVSHQEQFYSYDPIGNRIFNTTGLTRTEYVTNELNQYQVVSDSTQQVLGYDVDGNLTSAIDDNKHLTYRYNAENRLISVEPKLPSEGDFKSTFAYDYMGRRVIKNRFLYSGNEWTPTNSKEFVYDGWNLLVERDLFSNKNVHYIWGLDLSQSLQGAGGINGLLARIDSEKAHNYFYDGNGNVGQLVDTEENRISASYEYDPFGRLIVQTGSLSKENSFRFSTKYFDYEIGLYYYGYRFYSPELGRWVNRDPIGEKGGLDLYAFVRNQPISKFDLFGLKDSYFNAVNGTIAHEKIFTWLKAKNSNRALVTNKTLKKTFSDPSMSSNRPDVLDTDAFLIWEVKPVSREDDPGDNGQLEAYLWEINQKQACPYRKGYPSDLVSGHNIHIGILYDPVADDSVEIILIPGSTKGFLYYDLRNNDSLIKEFWDYAKEYAPDDLPDPEDVFYIIPVAILGILGWAS